MSEAAKKSWKREKIRHLKRRNFKIGAGKQNELELKHDDLDSNWIQLQIQSVPIFNAPL